MISLTSDNIGYDSDLAKKYWKSIQEIIRDLSIIKLYDKLLLHRLKYFIQDQLNSREFQAHLYLAKLINKEVYNSSDIEIKNRIKGIKIREHNIEYSLYLKPTEIKILQEVKGHVLKYSLGYICSYKTLIFIKNIIQIELEKKAKIDSDDLVDPIFKDTGSKQFFEYLIKEWFNGIKKPKSAISYAFYSMWIHSDLPTRYKDLKYKIKVSRIIEFADYWNENYSEKHKYNYKIQKNFQSARLKSISEITSSTYLTKLDSCIKSFEKLK
ncbi:MAG: hypothetical protein P8K77_05290 [Polaribacter sp.]|nr:hypothetical protein [Polaribacter sp.]